MSTVSTSEQIARQALLAKIASRTLAVFSSDRKNKALRAMAAAIDGAADDILFHNEIDVEAARQSDLNPAMIERLVLTAKSIKAMAEGVREIAEQADPVGEVLAKWDRPIGIQIEKVRVPLGVIGMIY